MAVSIAALVLLAFALAASAAAEPAAKREPSSRAHGLDAPLADWYASKARLADHLGLTVSLAYTALYQRASSSAFQPLKSRAAGRAIFGHDEAAGGNFEIFGALALWGRETGHDAKLTFKGEARHRLGTAVPPHSLDREIGSVWPTGTGYSEFDPTVVELWLKQKLGGDALEVHAGNVFPLSQYDFFPLDNFRTDFVDALVSFHPSIALPNYGLGANVTARPHRELYLRAGIGDANGEPERSGFETFFGSREYFSVLEAGFDPGIMDNGADGLYGDYHLTLWHADARARRAARGLGPDRRRASPDRAADSVPAIWLFGGSARWTGAA